MSDTESVYTHPQEVWDEKECARRSKVREVDGYGTKAPYPGMVASSSSAHPQYGQTQRWNGGCSFDGKWYQSECVPLPKIPASYEFYSIPTWGTYIRKKSKS